VPREKPLVRVALESQTADYLDELCVGAAALHPYFSKPLSRQALEKLEGWMAKSDTVSIPLMGTTRAVEVVATVRTLRTPTIPPAGPG
jgi:hypothetical protein